MLLSNFPGLTPAINSFVCRVCATASFRTGKDRANSSPEESPIKLSVPICRGTSAKEPLWKKPWCSSCFLTSSFSGCPCSFHANITYFWKGLINIKMCTSVTEHEHLHRALLQKWPFHFTFTLETEMTSKGEKPTFNPNYRPNHKTVSFCRLRMIFCSLFETALKLCLSLSQSVPRYWECVKKIMSQCSHLQDGTGLLQSQAIITVLSPASPPSLLRENNPCPSLCPAYPF